MAKSSKNLILSGLVESLIAIGEKPANFVMEAATELYNLCKMIRKVDLWQAGDVSKVT